jgi:hypothetical protein
MIERGLARAGAVVVFVNISHDLHQRDSNFLTVRQLP